MFHDSPQAHYLIMEELIIPGVVISRVIVFQEE